MNRKFLMLTGAVALVVVLLSLGDSLGGTPKAFADPSSINWDVILCDGTGAPNDPACADPLSTAGDGDGIVETGENPEMQTSFQQDLTPGTIDEPFVDLGNISWGGITPTAGSAVTDGDIVGESTYGLESNLVAPLVSNVSGLTGQPPTCTTTATLGAIYDLFDAELTVGDGIDTDKDGSEFPGVGPVTPGTGDCDNDLDDDSDTLFDEDDPDCAPQIDEEILDTLDNDSDTLIDEDNRTVSHQDIDGDGLGQDFEDNVLADCQTPGQNGLMDGVDCMVQALEENLIPSIGLGWPLSRAYGMAVVSEALGVETPVNNLTYELPPDPQSTTDYFTIAIIFYPGGAVSPPSGANLTGQTVISCPPFSTATRSFGVAKGNPAYDADGDTTPEGIAPGTVLLTAGAAGTYPYIHDTTTTDNYDGDSASQPWESCPLTVSSDTDLVSLGNPDPDFDRWDSACDPVPAGFDNDNSGTAKSYNLPVVGTWPMDPQNCNQTGYGFAGGWDCDQDVDGDGQLNTVDNCPLTPSGDVDMDGMEDGTGPVTPGTGDCYDGVDNDLDGTPGIDIDEDGTPNVGAGNCADTIDNDGDAMVDANDPDCAASIDQGDSDCAAFIEWQWDTDGDTVGDVCDDDPDVRGDGTGYKVSVHPYGFPGQPEGYHDHDSRCNDEITIPGTELTDTSPNGLCAGVGPDGVHGNGDDTSPYVDSGLDGTADWYDTIPGPAGTPTPVPDGIYQIGETIEVAVDADDDGHADGCEAVVGTDPLDTSSAPGPPSTPGIMATPTGTPGTAILVGHDCDGDTISDADEEDAETNPFPPPPVGGIAELPPLPETSAAESRAPGDGSGWPAAAYAALAGIGALAAASIAAGGWYTRRRFSHELIRLWRRLR